MAGRNGADVIIGAAVLLAAGGFLAYAVAHTGRSGTAAYDVTARFDNIDGLNTGADVRVGGVKIGSVIGAVLDPRTYQAVVTLGLQRQAAIPRDSSAIVTSDGLLGGKFVTIQPGGDSAVLGNGGEITVTQGSVSLEALLGKFIFSATGASKTPAPAPAAASAPAPSTAAPAAPPP